MAALTISEKILSAKSGGDARAGAFAVCEVDYALGTDGSAPMALDYFEAMEGAAVFEPERIAFCLDHYAPPASASVSALHDRMRGFSRRFGTRLFEMGEGIGLQRVIEEGCCRPGHLVAAADSHAVMFGALNCFGVGIGSSDLAGAMISGRVWLNVPETIRVVLEGELPAGVLAKDLILALAGKLGADGAAYQAIEFQGPLVPALELEDRIVLSNMSAELGAKAAIFEADHRTADYLAARGVSATEPVVADPGATYSRDVVVDASDLVPMLAAPHDPTNVVPVVERAGTPVQMVFIGTCTGGRARDFHQAFEVIEAAGGLHPGVQLVLTPASREVFLELTRDGTLPKLIEMGGVVTTPGCGACCGTAGVIPGDGMTVVSTANRNFKARMGNPSVSIFLASPAACGAAAAKGSITDPREVLSKHARS